MKHARASRVVIVAMIGSLAAATLHTEARAADEPAVVGPPATA